MKHKEIQNYNRGWKTIKQEIMIEDVYEEVKEALMTQIIIQSFPYLDKQE